MTSPILEDFITRARQIPFAVACDQLAIPQPGKVAVKPGQKKAGSRVEYMGPCPQCGGTDRFAVNRGKGVWNCRGCGKGGGDGLSLAAHLHFLELRGAGFLQACSILLCEPIPSGAETEAEDDRAAREARMEQARAKAEADRQAQAEDDNAFRQAEIRKARGLWLNATDCLDILPEASIGREQIRGYLKVRTGFIVPDRLFEHARFRARGGYYHGQDFAGRPMQIFSGPVMVLPFVRPGADEGEAIGDSGTIIGCHQTWIDLSNRDKARPVLWGVTKAGRDAGRDDPEEGFYRNGPPAADLEAGFFERLKTKKMRGQKQGGLLPLLGGPECSRWVTGEGIENVIAFAGAEEFREDTFYCTSGDLGNLAGPRDPASDFFHPTLTKPDKNGHPRRVKVKGPVPRPNQGPEDAMPVLPHVVELILVADGDSEPVQTASDMARAEARLSAPGRAIETIWPPEKTDFSGVTSAVLNKAD